MDGLSYWVHSCCEDCWNNMNPTMPTDDEPRGEQMDCCFCGALHASGIVVRQNPNTVACKGKTGAHEENQDG